ncbi:MAG: hypothetical protein HKN45_02620 [Flavobacteriales bacterium]|nr:hypothetical protein [Flavobacteriales bacterium]
MNKNFLKYTLLTCIVALIFVSCEKDIDTPPQRDIADGFLLDISDLRQLFNDSGTYKFTEDFNIYATVTADNVSGNFYKNVFIQDSTDALNMRTVANGGLYEGDRIRVNLNGAIISEYAGMLQLDSVDVDTQVVIQANQEYLEPTTITLDQIDPTVQAQLVRIENVEFVDSDLGQTYADAVNEQSENRFIQDCNGNQVILRTSGFASFAADQVPGRNGTITAIVGQFNDDMQLFIRDTDDLEFQDLRCDGSTGEYLFFKNFEDENLTSGGFSQQVVVGSDTWFVDDFGGNFFAKVTNFNGSSNDPSEVWYISPALDLTSLNSPSLSFMTMMNYAGPQLETYVSTDYGSVMDVENATWSPLQANYSPGGWEETVSGAIDLTPYSSTETYVAWRYTGSSSDGSTWELDNIAVFDN